jgi:twinkle protein
MEPIAPLAQNARPLERKSAIDASRSPSAATELSGSASIAGGQAATSSKLSSEVAEWTLRNRRLSQATLGRLCVASGTAFFPELERKSDAIFFKYSDGWKARSIPDKAFVASKGFKLSFWNLATVLQAKPKRVYICEGEFDACALVEAGIPASSVLSVPNGAKERPAESPSEQRGYDYVSEALAAGLNACKEFVWCGDQDGPGLSLRADMARLFGAARFRFIEWPEGSKDANDFLISDGPEALRDLVENGSMLWPVAGLYRMWELPEPPPLTLWNPGFGAWERKVMLAPRTMSVVTGHPGHGKSQMWGQIWFQVARAYAVPICVASFETRPKPHMRRQLRTLLIGELEKNMSERDIARADEWINDRYIFAVHPEQRPTLDWFLDIAEVAVVRHGARIIQIDPWNRLEGQRPHGESETDYIGRCLRSIHAFAHDLNCHVQIIAHPAKMDSKRRGEAPILEDISASKNWDNMVDQGFVVHRPMIYDGTAQRTEAVLYQRKARFEELGHPCKLNLNYRTDLGRFVSTDDEVPPL